MEERNGDCREAPIHQTGRGRSFFICSELFPRPSDLLQKCLLERSLVHLAVCSCDSLISVALLSKINENIEA